jgi:GPH family glycoside/pentoside/hexuronide:cation symporter
MSDTRISSKLPLGLKVVYGTGQFVDSVSGTALATFLLFYLTAVCGLSGSLTGASLFVALAVDAFVDPFVGSISDNTSSRWGRRHLFMFASFPMMFVGLGMLFTVPVGLQGWSLFAYVTGMALLLRFGLSAYIVPYIALGAELSDDYLERSRVIAWRSFFSVPATIVPIVLGYTVFLGGKAGLFNRAAYVPFGWTCAAILCLFGALAAFGTLSSIPRLHKTVPSTDHPLRRLMREVPEVFRNRSFLILFVTVLIFFVAQGTAAALNLHGGKFFWKLPVSTIQLLSITSALGLLLGIPVVAILGPHVEKRTMTLWSLAYIVIFQAGMPLARIAGLLPPNGPALTTILVTNGVVIYAAVTILAISFQSMMADAADEHELLFGARREGLYFSGTTFSAKAASGIGSFLAGVALDLIHFPVDIANKGGENIHIAAATVNDLGLVYGVGPAAMTALCIGVNWFYRIDRHAHARIQAELVQRRALAAANLPVPEALP